MVTRRIGRVKPHRRTGLGSFTILTVLALVVAWLVAFIASPAIAASDEVAPLTQGAPVEAPVCDMLVVYEPGYAVGSRAIQAELVPGPNRLVVEGLPATVDARSAELSAVGSRVRVESKAFDSANRCLVFTVVPESPGPVSLRLTYSFTGLSWSASYTAVLNGRLDEAGVSAWYCVSNRCGSALCPQSLTLVAGHTNTLAGKADVRGASSLGLTAVRVSCSGAIPTGTDCYIEAAGASAVPARMVYLIDRIGVASPDPSVGRKDEAAVMLALEITVSPQQFPIPLPGGRVTVYAHSGDGAAYLLGEDVISPIRTGGSVMLRLGMAPSLRVEKARTDQKKIGTSSWEEAYQIRIANSGSAQADVVVVEEFPGEWAILQSAPVSAARTPSGYARFSMAVPAGGRAELLYRVRYTL